MDQATIITRVVQALTWNCTACNAHCIMEIGLLNVPFIYVCPDGECATRYLIDTVAQTVKEEGSQGDEMPKSGV